MLCISPYSVRMRENNDQKNSEYGHFPSSVIKGVFKTLSIMYTVMEVFAKTGYGWKPLIIFVKISILEVWQGSEYPSGNDELKDLSIGNE